MWLNLVTAGAFAAVFVLVMLFGMVLIINFPQIATYLPDLLFEVK